MRAIVQQVLLDLGKLLAELRAEPDLLHARNAFAQEITLPQFPRLTQADSQVGEALFQLGRTPEVGRPHLDRPGQLLVRIAAGEPAIGQRSHDRQHNGQANQQLAADAPTRHEQDNLL